LKASVSKFATQRVYAAIILLALLASACEVRAQHLPVARAESEFRELVPFIKGWAQKNRGDLAMFKHWVLPYGPLDLEVRNGTHDEANDLRNVYLGVAGAAFGIDPRPLADSFHCGLDCTAFRRNDIKDKLPRIEKLVSSFRQLGQVRVLASWGIDDDFRVNELFQIMGEAKVTRPSPVMGFVPSGAWEAVERAKYIGSLGTNPEAVQSVLAEMRSLSVAALVREDDQNVRVVRVGISDNESGLIFSNAQRSPYSEGEKLRDGREVTLIELLKPNVFFYETT